jgi:hypothetical protein
MLPRFCRVSRNFVAKVENELLLSGRVVHPNEIQQERQLGPGAKTIDSLDAFVGRPVPSQVYFKNVALDETERVFRGTIEWQEEYGTGTTWQGCKKWIYEMKFDSEYTCILSGVVKSISTGNQEQEMSTFGMDLVYINAAVNDKFESFRSDDLDQYVRMTSSVRVRLETEGASNRTIAMMFLPPLIDFNVSSTVRG